MPPQNAGTDQIAQDVLQQISQAKTPLARLRVLLRTWHNVRHLSPTDRMAVAARVGLENADDLVKAIARHQGAEPPPEVLRLIDRAQHADAATVRTIAETAQKARDPRQRGELAGEGLRALESALAGPAPEPPSPPPPPPAPPVPAPVAAPPPSPPPPLIVVAPPPPPVVAPSPPPPAAAIPIPPEPPPRVEAPAPPPPRGPVELAGELAGIQGLTARFRYLRASLTEAGRLRAEELREVLEAFPEGWARRRALSELLEAGLPADAGDALALIAGLPLKDQLWCLGRLAERALSPVEREGVLKAAATPTARRRLAVRLGQE